MSYPDHVSQTERQIIDRVIANIGKLVEERSDVRIRIWDEEEMILETFNDFDADLLRSHVGHTELTRIVVLLPEPARASIMFIHGNEEDVLSDSSYSYGAEWLEKRLCEGAAE